MTPKTQEIDKKQLVISSVCCHALYFSQSSRSFTVTKSSAPVVSPIEFKGAKRAVVYAGKCTFASDSATLLVFTSRWFSSIFRKSNPIFSSSPKTLRMGWGCLYTKKNIKCVHLYIFNLVIFKMCYYYRRDTLVIKAEKVCASRGL